MELQDVSQSLHTAPASFQILFSNAFHDPDDDEGIQRRVECPHQGLAPNCATGPRIYVPLFDMPKCAWVDIV
ncbi:hypothetical protein CBOM_07499 [Ceraceosorus bombacis]|uniref:Uncharacterized protein n=1 Tax=Ceraceosorus bombacis TaxID=401625 RepID=A0A0N7L8X8_9BASI|nr:hypothetical protein CBOM_07499 [Ceraceosorus bombacis]